MSDPYVFTDQQLVDLRRYMGYPAYGNGNTGFQSYRFFQVYGVMEFRLANLSRAEGETVVNTYLAQISGAEQDLYTARANLQVESAGQYKHNPAELAQRRQEYESLRFSLCGFLNIPPGPGLAPWGNLWVM